MRKSSRVEKSREFSCVTSSASNTRRRRVVFRRRRLRFTRDSECGIQARDVIYLYPYELG
jgi:hypothetical protein